MFRTIMLLSPHDLEAAAYLTVGKLAPDYEGVELQVGGATVAAAVADCTGAPAALTEPMRANAYAAQLLQQQRYLMP